MRLELELGEKKKREQEALVIAKKDQEEKVVKDAEVAEEVANQQVTNSQLDVFEGLNGQIEFKSPILLDTRWFLSKTLWSAPFLFHLPLNICVNLIHQTL